MKSECSVSGEWCADQATWMGSCSGVGGVLGSMLAAVVGMCH